ncbi:hypothetical protein PPERSA_01447 [Pseudocohnilembus persalinus]|uniref:Uncharacterized protein n=1 Tax=Pseudocohnilembus persalinus TaxID=266149 RepID=A0A0V0QHA6_PSEPJ|nr:hypothetical protein PPERSA_01447 [Pseudocohnilembus persalinus]|eukprot:KRX01544.1 hypothetical protein PPERSA_01447 [Pseudocohnilembus persalinus]
MGQKNGQKFGNGENQKNNRNKDDKDEESQGSLLQNDIDGEKYKQECEELQIKVQNQQKEIDHLIQELHSSKNREKKYQAEIDFLKTKQISIENKGKSKEEQLMSDQELNNLIEGETANYQDQQDIDAVNCKQQQKNNFQLMRRQDFEILEGEGFLFNIFNYLYLSDPLNQQQKIKVNIPDTILFKYGKPKLWYFTGKEGKVLAKRAENMKIKDIQTKFLKNINDCNIVARFFQLKSNKNGQQELELKYYNAEQFEQFINTTDLDREGYLQKFIQPRGKFNKPYRSKLFPQVMETLCFNIAGHILNVNNFKHEVRNMELSFVLDQKDKLYLISADRIKTIDLQENYDKQKKFNFKITLPDFVKQTVLNAKYENEINLRVCPGCDKQTQIEKYEQVNLLEVIQAWQFIQLI